MESLGISKYISMASKVSIAVGVLMAFMAVPCSLNPNPKHGFSISSFISSIFREETFVFPEEALPRNSGYLTVNASSKARMFYAFYEAIEPTIPISERPIILWLQGGPGCSSMTGNFYEFGPWRVSEDLQLYQNQWPWNRKFGVLFIDNPVGSGFSIAEKDEDIPVDQKGVANNLYKALSEFYGSFPEFKDRVLFVAGESYAGKYVPSLGYYILMKSKMGGEQNEDLDSFGHDGLNPPFKLGGLMIGNGLTDPEIQVQTHATVAYSFGLIDKNQKAHVEGFAEEVLGYVHMKQWFEAHKARTSLMDWIQNVSGIATPLDMRRSVPYHCSSQGKDFLGPFLNQKGVKASLNAEEKVDWVPCNPRVRRIMANDTMKSVKWMVDKVLEEVPVLLYQGQYDIKDGAVSNEEWMRTLKWRGTSKFFDSERSFWFVGGKLAGYWRSYENLSHVVVLGAGHQVPADQSLHSQNMVERWVTEQLASFQKSKETMVFCE